VWWDDVNAKVRLMKRHTEFLDHRVNRRRAVAVGRRQRPMPANGRQKGEWHKEFD
jgi:hypothetical protein